MKLESQNLAMLQIHIFRRSLLESWQIEGQSDGVPNNHHIKADTTTII